MITTLIHDAKQILQSEISPETGIILDLGEQDLLNEAWLFAEYELSIERQTRLLSIYIAIKLALQRHQRCSHYMPGDQLTRCVLDGDYLYSFYVQLCLKFKETNFLTHMAPIVKRIQIQRVEGSPDDDQLIKALESFLQLEYHHSRKREAI